jgi:hypothetical protein
MDHRIKTQITPDDVIRSGACADGVYAWIVKHGSPTAVDVRGALKVSAAGEKSYIRRAAGLDGNGYGDGDGNGYGYGYGDGDGYGDGYGYGNGYGNGDGNGNGGFK